MKTLNLILTILFSITVIAADKKSKDEAIFNFNVKKYNSYTNYNDLIKNQNLSTADLAWLKKMKLNDQLEVPKMNVIGPMQIEIIVGKKIVSLEYKSNEQQFLLNSYILDLDSRTSLKSRIDYIQKVLSYTKFSWFDFFINKANADVSKSAFDLSFAINQYISETQKSFSLKNIINKSNKNDGLLVKSLLNKPASDIIGFKYSCDLRPTKSFDFSDNCGELSLEVDRIDTGLNITKHIHKVKLPRPDVMAGCSRPQDIKLLIQTEVRGETESGKSELSSLKNLNYSQVIVQSEETISKMTDENSRIGQALVKCCGDFNDLEKNCFKDLQTKLSNKKFVLRGQIDGSKKQTTEIKSSN